MISKFSHTYFPSSMLQLLDINRKKAMTQVFAQLPKDDQNLTFPSLFTICLNVTIWQSSFVLFTSEQSTVKAGFRKEMVNIRCWRRPLSDARWPRCSLGPCSLSIIYFPSGSEAVRCGHLHFHGSIFSGLLCHSYWLPSPHKLPSHSIWSASAFVPLKFYRLSFSASLIIS